MKLLVLAALGGPVAAKLRYFYGGCYANAKNKIQIDAMHSDAFAHREWKFVRLNGSPFYN